MPGCRPFSVSFNGDPDALYEKARRFAVDNGGTLTGDASGGSFSARVMGFSRFEGRYIISGNTMTVEITEKPLMLACSVIESAVREKLRGR